MTTRHRLLLVSYHALPSVTPGSLRVRWMASELVSRGWDVTLVTATQDALAPPGARVVSTAPERTWVPAGRMRTLWNDHAIPDRHVTWNRPLCATLRRLVAELEPDIILSTSPPHSTHLALRRMSVRARARWVTDFRDPWTAPERQRRHRIAAAVQRRMERSVLHACDAVMANTEGNRVALLRAFPGLHADRVHVVPNAYEPDEPHAGSAPDDAADITYVGEVYPGMFDRLLDALTRVRAANPATTPRVAVVGHVDLRERARVTRAGLDDHVEYRGRVSHEASIVAMHRARSLLLLLPDGANWTTCVPSKLYPYLASRRPVVAFVPQSGDAARIVLETGVGVVLDDDRAGAASQLSDFVARVRRGDAWGGRREEMISRYAAPALGARVDAILRGLLGEA